MIKMKDWKSMVANTMELTSLNKIYDLTFTAKSKKDEREDWTNSYINSVSTNVVGVNYDPIEVILEIENDKISLHELSDYILPRGKILVDATSLALPELIYLFMIMNYKNKDFDVIYVQPNSYSSIKESGVDSINTFELSDDGIGIQQLPPFVGLTENSTMMIFLGFEGHRVGTLLQTEELNTDNAICLLGIPAYKLGWEKNTLSNNYKQLEMLKNNKLKIVNDLEYPDHYQYSKKDFDKITINAKKYNAHIITTEKDYLRLVNFNRNEIFYIKSSLIISDEESLTNKLLKLNEKN